MFTTIKSQVYNFFRLFSLKLFNLNRVYQYDMAVLNTERAALPSSCCIRLSTINASIGEMSSPPIAGINPLKALR